ncbi:hypothetical protein ACLKA7_001292 [Drosophila subpalustris]
MTNETGANSTPQSEPPASSGTSAIQVPVIEKETELTPVEKLQHLRSCLSGAALDTIRSLEINEANYNIAMGILKDRFDNKRLILQAHVREIFGLD